MPQKDTDKKVFYPNLFGETILDVIESWAKRQTKSKR